MKKIFYVFLSAILAVTVITCVIHFAVTNYKKTNADYLYIFAYQTNISDSNASIWAQNLTASYPEMPKIRVNTFVTLQAGNGDVTVTSQNGWSQIVTRLGAKQGDILLLNNETFYSVMLQNNMLLPITYDFSDKNISDSKGTVYGIDVTGLISEGLLNMETSASVGYGQPLPVFSLDEKPYTFEGSVYEPRVIAAVYAGSAHAASAQELLKILWGENNE